MASSDFQKVLVAWGRRAQHHTIDYTRIALEAKRVETSAKNDENLLKQEALSIVAGNEYIRLFGKNNLDLRKAYSRIVGRAIFLISYGGASEQEALTLLTRLASEYDAEFTSYAGNFLLMNLSQKMIDFISFMVARRIIDQRVRKFERAV